MTFPLAFLTVFMSAVAPFSAETVPLPEHRGATLYVSKLGDGSDGLSWATAFTSIQTALDAVPDAKGGHTIVIRPDTYMEAMLSPTHPGAAGSYNVLVGDVDGALGSGTAGDVVIDSSDPKKGFKSYDWWSTIRATTKGWSKEHVDPTFSSIIWDRWVIRNCYATGSDAGWFWDCTDRVEPFTVVVEDCVGIGRAFGGGVASCLSREKEPITFRRCTLWSLDWWGDTAGAYVRVENKKPRDITDVVFEDCTMVSPQCALKGGNYGFHTYMRIQLDRCRLITLNFSQPQGTPTDGIIQSVQNGKYLHVDMKDTTLMGYKVFGVKVDKDSVKDLSYTTKGAVQAHVQFKQEVPKGIHPLTHWPVEVFRHCAPPAPKQRDNGLHDDSFIKEDMCEATPVLWKGRLCLMSCVRPGSGGKRSDYYLRLSDAESGEELARFAEGYGLACALVHEDTFYAFASRYEDKNWNDVTMFKSTDLKHWESHVVVKQKKEHLFNSSVCPTPDGFVMAYESNDRNYPAFTTKFAISKDLETWTTLPDALFGANRYTACPCIRYCNGYYYVLYLERRPPLHFFQTYITRSKDLRTWELSSANPVLTSTQLDDGINTSDVDLIEYDGKTLLYYTAGDQLTWMNLKRRTFDGSLQSFLESWYVQPGIRDRGDASLKKNATQAVSKPSVEDRSAWFREAKFGMFVHWGLYAVPARNNKGALASFVMKDEKIPAAEYEQFAQQFNPQQFDAAKWMQIAKNTGMRYLIFTSKHHEGFSMFNSALTDYDAWDQAPHRDFVGELVQAARDADMKIGFYYSMLDWHHPDYQNNLNQYIDEYLFGQVRELCTQYGPIDCIWFDGEWDHALATWRSPELIGMIRELQPKALVNDRVGRGERGRNLLVDFYTREQPVEIRKAMAFEQEAPVPWEACMTIGESWGYRKDDGPFKSVQEILGTLVDVVSRGGNLLLNVGPTSDGIIPPHLVARLEGVGEWMRVHGESIYGAQASPFTSLPTGKCTTRGNRLYLHLEKRPEGALRLPGLQNDIVRAWRLGDDTPLRVDNTKKSIFLPEVFPIDTIATVVVEIADLPIRVN